ncbi:hypothetical protein, partial [Alcanivorax sp. HI0003]
FIVDYIERQSVTAVTDVSYDLGGGSTQLTRVTVSDATAYEIGQAIKLFSEDLIPGLDPADNQKQGEYSEIGDIDTGNNWLYLRHRLEHSYTSGIQCAALNDAVTIDISGSVTFHKSGEFSGSTRNETVLIKGVHSPKVSGMSADGTVGEFLTFLGCYKPQTWNISARNLITDTLNKQFGYAIVERSCGYGQHHSPTGSHCRHVYTDGAGFNPDSDDPAAFGRNWFSCVYDGVSTFGQGSGFDTHPESWGVKFHNCRNFWPTRSTDGTAWGFQLRGRNGVIVNCENHGGDGLVMRSEYADSDHSGGHRINGFIHRPKRGEFSQVSPVRLDGVSGGRIDDVRATGLDVIIDGSDGPLVDCSHGSITLVEPRSAGKIGGASTGSYYRSGDGGQIYITGGESDLTGSPGTNIRLAKLAADDSVVECRRHKIIVAGASLAVLGDLSSSDGRCVFINTDMDSAPDFSNPFVNAGAGATIAADWVLSGGISGKRGLYELSKSGNFSLSGEFIESDSSDYISVLIDSSSAGASIDMTNFFEPVKGGQVMTVLVKPGGQDVVIKSAGTYVDTSGDITLTAGSGSVFVSFDGSWLRTSQ